ncbi:NUDIX hydrolase [Galbibacter pacificus]|uniref:NUDIX domain-containing protein n=1 Tax=Galbibacter pacificus TaxID=2996052 RepID=A0ABT6FVS0_9FLAO|nr:NUDIX domain-containing protein [Galbibacter pacificus]MDG3583711.1 NUDIX domain-containing protein [Galbibacter pacificus]MDG3587371.1 NUDIX domain-containing protein [Galbibacter pacificus]
MYEVFVNEHRIILTNQISKETDFKLFLMDTVDIDDVIKQLNKGKIKYAHIYYEDGTVLMKKFLKKIPLVVAAGGLVKNQDNENLFIFRNGKWDLPKGKVDKGETIEEAAIREVEEETGVKKLKIDSFLNKTYHVFKRNGTYKLKETHWFLMKSKYKGVLVPQCKENIEIAQWRPDTDIPKLMENSYENIKTLF